MPFFIRCRRYFGFSDLEFYIPVDSARRYISFFSHLQPPPSQKKKKYKVPQDMSVFIDEIRAVESLGVSHGWRGEALLLLALGDGRTFNVHHHCFVGMLSVTCDGDHHTVAALTPLSSLFALHACMQHPGNQAM